MKRKLIYLLVTILIFSIIGCQTNEKPNTVTTKPMTSVPPSSTPLKGKLIEKDKFSIVAPEKWEVMDIEGGVQIYKMSGEVFAIAYRGFNMNDTEAKMQVESMAKQYKGTEPKQIDLLGKQFWSTTFTAAGIPQVTNLRMENGVMLSIKYGGPNFEKNPDFQAILDSIVFK